MGRDDRGDVPGMECDGNHLQRFDRVTFRFGVERIATGAGRCEVYTKPMRTQNVCMPNNFIPFKLQASRPVLSFAC